MRAHSLRSREQSREKVAAIAPRFLAALLGGDGGAAAALAADAFTWFGRGPVDFTSDAVAVFARVPTELADPRVVEPAFLAAISEEARVAVFGDLSADDVVVLVDLIRRDNRSTVAVVVGAGMRVRCVTDAYAFRLAFERACG